MERSENDGQPNWSLNKVHNVFAAENSQGHTTYKHLIA